MYVLCFCFGLLQIISSPKSYYGLVFKEEDTNVLSDFPFQSQKGPTTTSSISGIKMVCILYVFKPNKNLCIVLCLIFVLCIGGTTGWSDGLSMTRIEFG